MLQMAVNAAWLPNHQMQSCDCRMVTNGTSDLGLNTSQIDLLQL